MTNADILVKSIEATKRALAALAEESDAIYQGSGGYYRQQWEVRSLIRQDVTVQLDRSFYYGPSYGSDPGLQGRIDAEVARRIAESEQDGEIARLRALDDAEGEENAVEYRRIEASKARLMASLAKLEAALAEAREREAYAAKRAEVLRSLGIAA